MSRAYVFEYGWPEWMLHRAFEALTPEAQAYVLTRMRRRGDPDSVIRRLTGLSAEALREAMAQGSAEPTHKLRRSHDRKN